MICEFMGTQIVSLVWWLEKEFGVKTNINPFKYAPRELPFAFVLRPIGRILDSNHSTEA